MSFRDRLIRLVRRHQYGNKKCLFIKYSGDTRYELTSIATHNGVTVDSLIATDLKEIDSNIIDQHDIIGIDEVQFINNVDLINGWADDGKIIYIAGLDTDYKRNPFPKIINLLHSAENVIKLKAVCSCGNDASFSHRINKDNKDIELIGSTESYVALCRNCDIRSTK